MRVSLRQIVEKSTEISLLSKQLVINLERMKKWDEWVLEQLHKSNKLDGKGPKRKMVYRAKNTWRMTYKLIREALRQIISVEDKHEYDKMTRVVLSDENIRKKFEGVFLEYRDGEIIQ